MECYLENAQVVFRGTVDFDDDDGSGTFVQQTLIRFKVSEVFRVFRQVTDRVWIDPGSFTSCYAEYRRNTDYLVFALAGAQVSAETITPKTKRGRQLPDDFRPPLKPMVYLAPECSGLAMKAFRLSKPIWKHCVVTGPEQSWPQWWPGFAVALCALE